MPTSISTDECVNCLSNGANRVINQNGHANGYTNSHENGHLNGNPNAANGAATSSSHANGHANSVLNGSHDMNDYNDYNGYANGYLNGSATGRHANGHTNGTNGVDLENTYSNIHPHDLPNANKEVPVAIYSMATRLSGGIRNERDLYKFLLNKRDARSVVGADRYDIDGYYSPHGQSGTISTNQGYFLNDLDYANMDLSMFTFITAEAEQVDPHH